MSTNAFTIDKGMDVYSSDGEKIGTVGEIFSGEPETQDSSGTPYSDVDAGIRGPVSTEAPQMDESAADSSGELAADPGVVRMPVSSGVGTYNTGMETTGFAAGAPGAVGAGISGAGGAGDAALTPSDTKYFEVKHGGFMGFGGDTLYVPFNAVDAVAPGTVLTLNCTAEECVSRYRDRPRSLSEES